MATQKDMKMYPTAVDQSGPDGALVVEEEGFDEPAEPSRKEAAQRAELERTLTIREAAHYYRWAIIWCLLVSMTVIMEGYDTILIGNFYAFPTFQRKYGKWVGVSPSSRSGYQLDPSWQAAVGNGSGIGGFFGALANGYLVSKFGQKNTIVASLVLLSAFIFVTFFAQNIGMLLAGQILCGLPWGVFATSSPAYASELLPMVLRVYFTSWTNMCFIIGQLIAAGWTWPLLLIPVLWFAPESPWHLVRKGRIQEAEDTVSRLQRQDTPVTAKQTVATILYVDNLERELSVGTSYWECFKGAELRRTEIACLCFAGQVLSGTPIAYNSTYFFEQVGLPSETVYNLNIGGTGLALFAAVCSWIIIMPRVGRRTTYLFGTCTMGTLLYIVGILNTRAGHYSIGLSQAVLTMVWKFCFQLSVGQLGWAIPAEIGSTRLRQKTIVLARNSYYVVLVVSQVLQPYIMNPTAWNLKGYAGFIWGSTAFCVFVWAFFRLPETKGRSFEQLDILFARKTPARKFSKTNVDAFDEDAIVGLELAKASGQQQ